MTLAIMLMGMLTVVLSIYAGIVFYRFSNASPNGKTRLSGALMWQLYGEAVIGFGTVIFAAAAHSGSLADWPLEAQSALRFAMFFATSVTTMHLVRTIKTL